MSRIGIALSLVLFIGCQQEAPQQVNPIEQRIDELDSLFSEIEKAYLTLYDGRIDRRIALKDSILRTQLNQDTTKILKSYNEVMLAKYAATLVGEWEIRRQRDTTLYDEGLMYIKGRELIFKGEKGSYNVFIRTPRSIQFGSEYMVKTGNNFQSIRFVLARK